MSFVSLVVREAVEKSSIFLKENVLIFLYTSFLSLKAKFWLHIDEVFIVASPPERPKTARANIPIPQRITSRRTASGDGAVLTTS